MPPKNRTTRKTPAIQPGAAQILNALPDDWQKYFYKFGQQSMGLLALLLRSNGTIMVFARRRPQIGKPMSDLYWTEPVILESPEDISFRFALRDQNADRTPKVGILSVEALNWPSPYEIDRIHMLGYTDPFGIEEIEFARYPGGASRPPDMPANRQFSGVFRFNPGAGPKNRADLTLKDIQSGGMGTDIIHVSALDRVNSAQEIIYAGGVMVAVRVPAGHFDDGCVRLDFFGGPDFQVTTADMNRIQGVHSFVLNTSADPTLKTKAAEDGFCDINK